MAVVFGGRRGRMETELKMIFNFMTETANNALSLYELRLGETAVVHDFSLAPHVAEHLMNLGFIPGVEVRVTRSGPGGDPRVYRVDGTEVALRRDVSRQIEVRRAGNTGESA
jgi:ferrous iron transport protein A